MTKAQKRRGHFQAAHIDSANSFTSSFASMPVKKPKKFADYFPDIKEDRFESEENDDERIKNKKLEKLTAIGPSVVD